MQSIDTILIGLQSSSPIKLFQIIISGINLEIINYFKIVCEEKRITININKLTSIIFFRLSIASSSNAYYPNSTPTTCRMMFQDCSVCFRMGTERSKCVARVIIESWCGGEFTGNVSVVMRSGAWESVRIIGRRRGCVIFGKQVVPL